MSKRSEYEPGFFSWVDLTTSDADGAKEFYGALFGWDYEDNEIPGDGGVYTMCKLDGDYVAAIPGSTDQAPPHWNNYVTVANVDESAAKAKELGADMVEEPFDVMEAGRMAFFNDPTGAALCIWQAGEAIGAQRVNEPGCLTWNELHTPDPAKALEFYSGLFGWSTEEMDTGEGSPSYSVIKNGDRSNGGVMPAQEGESPNWLPYFVVESREEALAKAKDAGGQATFQMDIGPGKLGFLADPQGAVFAVYEGEVAD
jgi:uncharacterized protein